MESKKAARLREMLLKSSKEELIELIMGATALTFATFPWFELVLKAKLKITERKAETASIKAEAYREKLLAIPESECTSENPEAVKLMCDINRYNAEYMRHLQKSIALEKEIYG